MSVFLLRDQQCLSPFHNIFGLTHHSHRVHIEVKLVGRHGPVPKVPRWQNLIPSFPCIVLGWRAWGRNPRKGRDQILQRSAAEPYSISPKGQTHTIFKSGYCHLATMAHTRSWCTYRRTPSSLLRTRPPVYPACTCERIGFVHPLPLPSHP